MKEVELINGVYCVHYMTYAEYVAMARREGIEFETFDLESDYIDVMESRSEILEHWRM